ncbi:MAG: DNA polymerase III subunit gamma/tau [Syntrophales bacterium]|nr:DNA polymerase III subunit gamma/tau [Syntrophales bacterium]
MEYLVIARKWRPQVFEDVVGQDHVVKTLQNAISRSRVAHAFIFSGPRGVGKTSVARILAKALNCGKGPIETPCNECTNCREITDGTSLDVYEIDGASNRGIDEIRELRENVKFSPASSRYKIYIIDEVHMLTKEAFNALLKTLEEPPSHVIFIFATTETHKVPATILSRCQRFDFKRIPQKLIIDKLRHIASLENITISETGLDWIAEGGDGSMRDAQSIFDQVISYAGTDIKDGDIKELLGLTDRGLLFDLSAAVFERNAGACLKMIDEGYYSGLDMKYFYQVLMGHFRNLLLTKILGGDVSLVGLGGSEIDKLKEQVEGVSRETLQRLLDVLIGEEEDIRRSINPRLNIELVLAKMAYLEPMVPVDEILGKMENLERKLSSGEELSIKSSQKPLNVFEKLSESEKGRAGYEIKEEMNLENLWEDFKSLVKKKGFPLWSKIEPGKFLGYENGCLRIGFPRGYVFLDYINEKIQKDRLTEISKDFFREDVVVKIESVEPDPEDSSHMSGNGFARARNNSGDDIKKEALNQPLLQKVLDVFEGAEVKEVIPRGNH